MSFLVNAQKETSPITVGASFGMLSEMGSIKSEGFNYAFDLNLKELNLVFESWFPNKLKLFVSKEVITASFDKLSFTIV